MELISLAISFAALAFSLFVYFRHDKKLHEQQLQLNKIALRNEQLKEEESKHARIQADVEHNGNSRLLLVVQNTGAAVARNVNLSLNPQLAYLSPVFPIDVLNPGDSVRAQIILALNDPIKTSAVFCWEDDAGKQTQQKTLTF